MLGLLISMYAISIYFDLRILGDLSVDRSISLRFHYGVETRILLQLVV